MIRNHCEPLRAKPFRCERCAYDTINLCWHPKARRWLCPCCREELAQVYHDHVCAVCGELLSEKAERWCWTCYQKARAFSASGATMSAAAE